MLTYPDPTPVLAELYTFSVFKKPMFASNIFQMISGREFQIIQQAYPLWEFELAFDALRSETQNITTYQHFADLLDVEKIAVMYAACAGQYGRFFFDDFTDNSRSAQAVATGDGVTTTFRVKRTWGSGALALTEPVGGVNTDQAITVYLDAVAQSDTSWSISADKQYLVFNSAPGNGVAITMDFSFYYLCRFIEDDLDLDQFMYNLWQVRSMKFRSVKD